ncbi:hypothetical protein ACFLXO_08595 [Chloroflexota bacterium]
MGDRRNGPALLIIYGGTYGCWAGVTPGGTIGKYYYSFYLYLFSGSG